MQSVHSEQNYGSVRVKYGRTRILNSLAQTIPRSRTNSVNLLAMTVKDKFMEQKEKRNKGNSGAEDDE
jgi:hypothetical protein